MDLYQNKNPRLIVCFGLAFCFLVCGTYGALSEIDFAALAFDGILIGAGLVLVAYAIRFYRRSDAPDRRHAPSMRMQQQK